MVTKQLSVSSRCSSIWFGLSNPDSFKPIHKTEYSPQRKPYPRTAQCTSGWLIGRTHRPWLPGLMGLYSRDQNYLGNLQAFEPRGTPDRPPFHRGDYLHACLSFRVSRLSPLMRFDQLSLSVSPLPHPQTPKPQNTLLF